MSRFTAANLNPAPMHDRRRAILARAPFTAHLAPEAIETVLEHSSLATHKGGTAVFARGEAPTHICLVGSGTVQLRAGAGGIGGDSAAPAMHVRLYGPGDLVADRELAFLAAGVAGTAPGRHAACVLGAPAEILAIDQAALAGVLACNPAARETLAHAVAAQLDALDRLANDLAGLKNFGKVRLARLLLEFFDHMGQLRGGALQITHPFSHGEIAAMLGLTRRSVVDDILALEAFDAIDHQSSGHLVLRDRGRLERIAAVDPQAGRPAGAAAWLQDVESALAAGDTLRAVELAREARLYHPRDADLGYSAALAALRAGDPQAAQSIITDCEFSADDDDEQVAALAARVLKERAFTSKDRETLRAFALQSAHAYAAVHRRTKGRYSALNAAAMFYVAGQMAAGQPIARALVAARQPAGAEYWAHATRAEAFWLLGETQNAAAALNEAVKAADMDDGKLATTRRQFQLLAALLGRDAALPALLPARKIHIFTQPPAAATELTPSAISAAYLAVTTPDDLVHYAARKNLAPVAFVLAAPAETLLRHVKQDAMRLLARSACHLADPSPGQVTPARRLHAFRLAAGLGCLAAAAAGAGPPCLDGVLGTENAWPDWAAPDSLAQGRMALLWIESLDEASVADLTDGAAADRLVSGHAASVRFHSLSAALSAAQAISSRAWQARRDIRICLDVETLSGAPLETALLPRARPLTRPGEVFATEAAAAELALLRRADITLAAVGRVRSQGRFGRLRVWAVGQTPSWA